MNLFRALLLPEQGVTFLIGAGGKSTLMRRLAEECRAEGIPAAVGTTTHIGRTQGEAVGPVVSDEESLARALSAGLIPCAALPDSSNPAKLSSPPADLLLRALALAGRLIVEADGARCLPVKAPGPQEPCFFVSGGTVVAVAGLSALGNPLSLICHRPELACSLLEVSPATLLTPALLARLLTSERGQFKHVGDPARFRILLNQADGEASLSLAEETAWAIQRAIPGCRVVAAALREPDCVKGVFGGCL